VTFLLFVLSAVVMEAILAYDQRRERARKASRSTAGSAATPAEEPAPDPAGGLLPLFEALDQYAHGPAPELPGEVPAADPSRRDSAYNRENVRPE
jgi:hypothetical protein